MKRSNIYLSVLFLFVFVSCEKKQINFKYIEGHYKNVECISDTPLDLNSDGIKNTNLYNELSDCSCNWDGWCYVAISVTDKNFVRVYLMDLTTLHPPHYAGMRTDCLRPVQTNYNFTIHSNNNFEITYDHTPYKEENEHLKLGHLQKMEYKNDTIICNFTKSLVSKINLWMNYNKNQGYKILCSPEN